MEHYNKEFIDKLNICIKEGHDFGEWEKVNSTEYNYFGNSNHGSQHIEEGEYQRKCLRCGTIQHSKYLPKSLVLTIGGKNEK